MPPPFFPPPAFLRLLMCVSAAQSFLPLCLTFQPQQRRRTAPRRPTKCWASTQDATTTSIALTREEGKNEKLRRELENRMRDSSSFSGSAQIVELPCIAHADGDDLERLEPMLRDTQWDYVAVTSPEAARVLASVWDDVIEERREHPHPSVAVVGKATQSTLESLGIRVDFCPSKALAKVLVQELPKKGDATTASTVLYPASAKAATTLQDGLIKRGFSVTRLNTYDTVTATWSDRQKGLASTVGIACFGSPSAVEGWLQNTNQNTNVTAACIGETSAIACRQHGWREDRIFYPEKPGIDGWAEKVEAALCHINLRNQNVEMG